MLKSGCRSIDAASLPAQRAAGFIPAGGPHRRDKTGGSFENLAVLCGAALGLLLISGMPAAADTEPATAQPLAIRRVLIPPDRVPAELERARRGTLVPLTRQEFEERV